MKTAIAIGLFVALVAGNIYLFVQLDRMRTELATLRESMDTQISNLKESSTVSAASHRRQVNTLRDELTAARKQASMAAGEARTEAVARAEMLAKKLAEEQQKQQQLVANELNQVKDAATSTNAKIADVSGDVNTVKTQVASTKTELEKTISDLKKVTGDLGVQSGYIATNAKELAVLKRLGERNIFEFKLAKSKQPQRVGDITMLLKKADTKRNRYTIEVMADDKKTEKRDRNINEPVQFYVSKARQPYEIVVNEVGKDLIVGYLTTPKDQVARN